MRNYYDGYFPGDIFDDPAFMTGIGVFFTIIVIFILIFAVAGLVLYILRSVGLYRLAENRGMSGAGLAWIPIVGIYRIGSIADDISEREGSRTYFRHLLLAGNIISCVFSTVTSGAALSSIADLMDSMGPRGYYGGGLPGSFLAANSLSSLVSLISLATFVITIIALNKVYKSYRPASSTAWTVLSVIFPFMQSIFPFVIRNDVPVPPQGIPSQGMPWNGGAPQGVPPAGIPPQGGYYPPQDGRWQAPPPNPGYPPPFQPQQPANPGGYYPPRAPEPPAYQPPQVPEQAPPTPPWESGTSAGGTPPSDD